MTIEITQLGPDDARVLNRVADDVFDAAIDPVLAKAYLSDPGNLLFVALRDGVVVGQAAGVVHRRPDQPTELYIDNLGVAPAFQRCGVARRLVEALFTRGRELGCQEAWVGTETDNVPARNLYESLGDAGETFVLYAFDLGEAGP